MGQISLYAIIILLITNMVTGGLYFTTKVKLTETESTLSSCTQANQTNNTTISVKETVTEANDSSCTAKIEEVKKAYKEQCDKQQSLTDLYNKAKEKLEAAKKTNGVLATENNRLKEQLDNPVEFTDEEAAEIVDYLDTVVPRAIEHDQLYQIRDPNKN